MKLMLEVLAMIGVSVAAVGSGIVYAFNTFATVDQMNDISYPIYKKEIRELRKEAA